MQGSSYATSHFSQRQADREPATIASIEHIKPAVPHHAASLAVYGHLPGTNATVKSSAQRSAIVEVQPRPCNREHDPRQNTMRLRRGVAKHATCDVAWMTLDEKFTSQVMDDVAYRCPTYHRNDIGRLESCKEVFKEMTGCQFCQMCLKGYRLTCFSRCLFVLTVTGDVQV